MPVPSPFPIIDTHTHLSDPVFDPDRSEVLKRAQDAGVKTIFLVSETPDDALKTLALCRDHPMLKPLCGLYPGHADEKSAEILEFLIREHRNELIGIGEVGLDHWIAKEEADRGLQKRIFQRFIRLALELDLPLNVHSRSAGREVIDALVGAGAKRVQLHAFDGKVSSAMKGVEAGFFFSIPPSIVRSNQKQKLVRQLPLSCILLETDSPVLGSQPGIRNEPAFILQAAQEVGRIQGIPLESVLEAAYANTRSLYRLS